MNNKQLAIALIFIFIVFLGSLYFVWHSKYNILLTTLISLSFVVISLFLAFLYDQYSHNKRMKAIDYRFYNRLNKK